MLTPGFHTKAMSIKRVLILGAMIAGLTVVLPVFSVVAAIQLENRDSFCGSCHTEPEATYLARSTAAASDLASSHAHGEVRCIDCHSGKGISGRMGSLAQGSLDLLAYLQDDYRQPARSRHPLGDAACLKCHLPTDMAAPDESGLLNGSHYHLAAYLGEWQSRASGEDSRCGQCHQPHALGGDSSQGFLAGAVLNPACEGCHTALGRWIP